MAEAIIQIRVNSNFKLQVQKLARQYDLPIATFIKLLLGDFIRAKKNFLIANLTEQKEIDTAFKDYLKAKKANKLKSIDNLFKNAHLSD